MSIQGFLPRELPVGAAHLTEPAFDLHWTAGDSADALWHQVLAKNSEPAPKEQHTAAAAPG